ncbi:MAG: hypothetical protein WB504_15245, partial [Pseudolabrys sp.]
FLRLLAAALPLRAVRFFARPRFARGDVAVPKAILDSGPRTSENISHPIPAAIRAEAMGLFFACLAKRGRMSSPIARGLTPNKSLTTVDGET